LATLNSVLWGGLLSLVTYILYGGVALRG